VQSSEDKKKKVSKQDGVLTKTQTQALQNMKAYRPNGAAW